MSLSDDDEDEEEETGTDDTFDPRDPGGQDNCGQMNTLPAWLAVKDKCISLLDYNNLVCIA